ncbi:hypothetical protein I3842_16G059400 [Carya illinoinensis]|uniref:PGG domain-containing protein n=1 Tax=Carya illinoinensis TaxID=32201 RepID=A0A922A0F7_CARIL|nr:hypothetical protein I3842_16G059400 [Carya illinoinensis]
MASQSNQPEEIQPNQPEETPNQANQPEEIQPNQPNQPEETPNQPNQPAFRTFGELVSYLRYKPGRDTVSDVRSALLVVMALIAAATFQAVINPPFGVSQDTNNNHGPVNQKAGTANSGSGCKVPVFVFVNTLAFASSGYVISYLVYGFPFYLLIWIGLFSFSFTYGFSIPSNTCGPPSLNALLGIFAFVVPPVMAVAWYNSKRGRRRGRIARPDESV